MYQPVPVGWRSRNRSAPRTWWLRAPGRPEPGSRWAWGWTRCPRRGSESDGTGRNRPAGPNRRPGPVRITQSSRYILFFFFFLWTSKQNVRLATSWKVAWGPGKVRRRRWWSLAPPARGVLSWILIRLRWTSVAARFPPSSSFFKQIINFKLKKKKIQFVSIHYNSEINLKHTFFDYILF